MITQWSGRDRTAGEQIILISSALQEPAAPGWSRQMDSIRVSMSGAVAFSPPDLINQAGIAWSS